MKIKRILTNNAVITLNEKKKEQIICGKGIAYKKKAGDEVDISQIDKIFVLMPNDSLQKQMEQLLTDIPLKYVELSNDIVNMARLSMNMILSDSLIISLADHLWATVSRLKEGVNISNGLKWEIRRFYEREYEVGLLALEMSKKVLCMDLPEDEAAYIAMHIVNAETDNYSMEETSKMIKFIGYITRIVRMFFGIDFDESSGYYYRFVTHLNYFARRVFRGEQYEDNVGLELPGIIFEKYAAAYECAEKIENFILEKRNYQISDEEKMYLTIHIQMVVSKGSKKNKTNREEELK